MKIDNLKIGDVITLDVVTQYSPCKLISQKVTVRGIYPKYILFDNGLYKFCCLKFDMTHNKTLIA